jgi:hypothetical protein
VQEARARIRDCCADSGSASRSNSDSGRGDGRHLRDQADRGEATLFGVFDVERVVIERGQRTDHAAQHRHRVRVVAEAAEEALERLVHHRVMRDFVLEAVLNCCAFGSSPFISR